MKAALLRKFGPLPAYAWLGILAAGALVYRHFFPGPAPAAAASTDTGAGGADSGFAGGAAGGGSGSLPPDQASPVPEADLGNAGTPVIFDPLTGGATDYSDNVYDPVGRGVANRDLLPGRDTPPEVGRGVTNLAALPKPAAVRKPAARLPGRPSSTRGRQTARRTHTAAARRPTPVRKAIAKPAVPSHRAPPMAAPKKKKAVLRSSAQQAHNHGEPAPARARTTAAAAPSRTSTSVRQAEPLPARAAAPARGPAATSALQLAPGAIPQPGKAYVA